MTTTKYGTHNACIPHRGASRQRHGNCVTSPRPSRSRCIKTLVRSLLFRPQLIPDKTSLKLPRDTKGPSPPESLALIAGAAGAVLGRAGK